MPRKTKMTSITSPEKTAQINPNNLRLRDDFLLYMKSLQRSPGTIAGYKSDLTIFFTYILDYLGNKDFQKVTKRDIIAFQNWMVENDLSPARIRRVKSSMSSMSNYCENILSDDDPDFEGFRSIIRKIENPALTPVREKTVWHDGELEILLEMLLRKEKYDQACFVALAMYGGRRKSELCRFKVDDFSDSRLVCDGALYKSSPILTKGGKYLECYTLANKFKPYLDAWLKYRAENGIDSEWLFPDRDDPSKHIALTTVNSWAVTMSRLTKRDFYFHSLRHYYCSALIRAGIPDNVIVDIVGWASSDMLKIYNDNPKDEQIAKYFKGGEISIPEQKGFNEI